MLRTKRSGKKGLRIYKPCMVYFHSSSTIKVEKYLNFNRQWDDDRILRNQLAGSFYVGKEASVTVDGPFDIYAGSRITVNDGACLSLGSGYMNHDCVIDCFSSIRIGNGCVISERVVIRDSDNHKVLESDNTSTAPITVEDHVWISMNSLILKGVTIGEGAIVATGSVVVKDVPPHTMVGGVPARVLKTDVHWE